MIGNMLRIGGDTSYTIAFLVICIFHFKTPEG